MGDARDLVADEVRPLRARGRRLGRAAARAARVRRPWQRQHGVSVANVACRCDARRSRRSAA
ncbi:MAG: hypothetical protein MZV64_21640 [Ignavibacteriales bacterium]|nr:hypothetical protein [Ignavibacteriales bacterium]